MRRASMTPVRTFLGQPYPLGATWMGNGVNFAIFSEHATGVELCLVDNMEDAREEVRIPLKERTDQVWHVFWPDLPEQLRGTFAGLGSPPAIDYFKKLGVTAVELLPVHAHIDEKLLVHNGLTNYWGYNTIGFFAPHGEYSSSGQMGQQVAEFKAMVRSLHAAGIEVILDVVYNHTGEGNHLGPTLCFRGIDNLSY